MSGTLTNILRVALGYGWNPVKVRPSQCLIHILLLQPLNNGVKVFHQRGGIQLSGPYGLLEHLGPRFRRAGLENLPGRGREKACSSFTEAIVRAL